MESGPPPGGGNDGGRETAPGCESGPPGRPRKVCGSAAISGTRAAGCPPYIPGREAGFPGPWAKSGRLSPPCTGGSPGDEGGREAAAGAGLAAMGRVGRSSTSSADDAGRFLGVEVRSIWIWEPGFAVSGTARCMVGRSSISSPGLLPAAGGASWKAGRSSTGSCTSALAVRSSSLLPAGFSVDIAD